MKLRRLFVVAVAALSIPLPALAEGDAETGKNAFKPCMPCHAVDGRNRVGPTLAGIVGRPVASVDGFKYSKAMIAFAEDGKLWTEELLTDYLAAPRTMVKGTSMAFAGVRKPEDIRNLIAYLKDPVAAQ